MDVRLRRRLHHRSHVKAFIESLKTGKTYFICVNCFQTVKSELEEEDDGKLIHYYATCPNCHSKVEVATVRKKLKI